MLVAVFSYLVIRQLSANWQVKVKTQAVEARNRSLGIGTELQAQLNALPRVIQELHQMKLKMQAQGATEQMLKPIQQQIWLAETAQKWSPVLRFMGPILNRVSGKLVDRGMTAIERLLTA